MSDGRSVRLRTARSIPRTHPVLERPRSIYENFDAWWEKVQAEDREVLCLETSDGHVRGVAVFAWRTETHVKLCTFSLHPDETGIGTVFLRQTFNHLATRGCGLVYATLRRGSFALLRFFENSGMGLIPEKSTASEWHIEKTLFVPSGA